MREMDMFDRAGIEFEPSSISLPNLLFRTRIKKEGVFLVALGDGLEMTKDLVCINDN